VQTLRQLYEKHPLLLILALAAVLRLWCAFYNNTPMQEDDYANVISPALNALQTGAAIETVGYRLSIFPILFYGFMKPFQWLGVESYGLLVSCGLAVVGLFSLSFVAGMYKLAGNFVTANWQRSVALVAATYFIMPLLGTRTFLSCFALNTVPWAFYYLTRKEARSHPPISPISLSPLHFLLGGFFIGLSVVMRFQVVILVLTTLGFLLWCLVRKQISPRSLVYFLGGGLISLIILGLCDVIASRYPLQTLFDYIIYNYAQNITATNYGSSAWYNYLGIVLLIFLPPFSLVLLYPFWSGARKSWLMTLNLGVFIIAHSFLGNKLPRFILPVLPLFMLITFIGLQKAIDVKIVRWAYRGFWALNLLLLGPVLAASSQRNIVDAAVYLQNVKERVYLKGIDLWKQGYLGYHNPHPVALQTLSDVINRAENERQAHFYVLNFLALEPAELARLVASGIHCKFEKKFEPSLPEKLVIKVNPRPNRRRMTTYLYRCSRQR